VKNVTGGLYNNTPVMLHSIDIDGKILSVSDYWLEKFGYKREEVIGRKSTDFLTEESKKYALEYVLPKFLKNGFCNNVTYRYVKKNNEVMDILLSAIAEKDENGNITKSLAVSIDVSEQKKSRVGHKTKKRNVELCKPNSGKIYFRSGIKYCI